VQIRESHLTGMDMDAAELGAASETAGSIVI
jgi:hypothetical protein